MRLLDIFRTAPKAVEAPEKPSHARRIAELEARCDDLEGEVEKLGRSMRTWLGRIAKREARAATAALDATPAADQASDGAEIAPSTVNRLDKSQLRRALANGSVRRIGG
jgi:hypothetical protein